MRKIWVYLLTVLAGAVNGVMGTGGGTVVMPALYKVMDDGKNAHQSVCAFVLPLAILGASVRQAEVGKANALFVLAGGVTGGLAGAIISRKTSFNSIKILFGSVILYMGVRMIIC